MQLGVEATFSHLEGWSPWFPMQVGMMGTAKKISLHGKNYYSSFAFCILIIGLMNEMFLGFDIIWLWFVH